MLQYIYIFMYLYMVIALLCNFKFDFKFQFRVTHQLTVTDQTGRLLCGYNPTFGYLQSHVLSVRTPHQKKGTKKWSNFCKLSIKKAILSEIWPKIWFYVGPVRFDTVAVHLEEGLAFRFKSRFGTGPIRLLLGLRYVISKTARHIWYGFLRTIRICSKAATKIIISEGKLDHCGTSLTHHWIRVLPHRVSNTFQLLPPAARSRSQRFTVQERE